MEMTTPRALRTGAAVLGALLFGFACDREAAQEAGPQSTAPEQGGVAVVAEQADISTPLTILAQQELEGDLGGDVTNMSLVRSRWEDGEVVNLTADQHPLALARRVEYLGPDSSAIRFHMRGDARWSDGQPVTAHDFVFTYGVLGDPGLASTRQDYVENLDSVVAQNDSTVTFHFRRRYPDMLSHASLPPLPRHVLGDTPPAEIRSHPAVLNPAGGRLPTSGPWMIGEWVRGERIVLVPNPNFQPRPHLDQLVFRIIPEPTSRLVEFQTGAVDMFPLVAHDQIPTLRAQVPNARLELERQRAYDYVAYNPKGFAPFADPEVRRALTQAIDRERLVQALQLDQYAAPAAGPYPPIFGDYALQAAGAQGYDPQRARQILQSRGWRDSDGDGILDKDGQPFRFTLTTNAGSSRRADAVQIIQQQWKQIGVDAQLRQVEFGSLMESLMKQNYQASLSGWISGLTPDFISNLYRTGAPQNITGYSDPQVDALFAQALQQPTEDAARPFWKQAAERVVQDQPYTWLYYLDRVDAVQPRLRDTRIDTYGRYQNTWEWWIPRAQQRGRSAARDSLPPASK